MTQPSDLPVPDPGLDGDGSEDTGANNIGTGTGVMVGTEADVGAGAVIGSAQTRPVAEVLADVAAFSSLPPGVFNTSDSGNARRFAYLYGGIVRYAADSKMWYVWTGTRWQPDAGDLAVLGLTSGVPNYVRNVESALMPDDQAAYGRFALSSESESSRRHMLKLAAAEPGIKIVEEDLDANPRVLVLQNGTLDLKTGELRESRASDLCTRRAGVSFDADATCPLWESHVKLITDGSPALTAYLQRACGYSLTGLISEQKFWFLWGDGQNGKNVFVETIAGMLGDYGSVAPPGLLTGGTSQHPTILADLRGARVVVVDETGDERINDARVKMLTGSARVKARFVGRDFFEYDSTMKLWVLGNAKPVIRDQSDGTWRRMQLVPFTVKIPDTVKRTGFVDELRAEWPGILNWCLRGLRDWQQLEGMGTPDVVADAVNTYREEEDEIGQWLDENCEGCADDVFTPGLALYSSYTAWCQANGIKPKDVLTQVAFGRAITGRTVTDPAGGKRKIGETATDRVAKKKTRGRHGIKLVGGAAGTMFPPASAAQNG